MILPVGLLAEMEPDVRYAIKELLLKDHLAYSRFFYRVTADAKMGIGRHHRLMANALDDVIAGKTKRLIISVPPRYTKTIMAVGMFVSRGFAINPRAKFVHLSYANDLVMKNSGDIKDIIESDEYQALYGVKIRHDISGKALWETSEGGEFRATAAGGQVTGFGAGLMEEGFTGALIMDDMLKPDDSGNKDLRDRINQRFTETIRSRCADENTPIILIMQRIHNHDMTGYLLRGGSGDYWHHLNLPVMIEENYQYPVENTHGIEIEHDLEPGPLWPEKHDETAIHGLKHDGKTYSAQYMQDPRLSANPVFPPESFHSYEVRPRTLNIAILVDPSSGRTRSGRKSTTDRTAMAVIGIDNNLNKYLLDGYCHRMNLSERWEKLKNLYNKWDGATGVQYLEVGYEQYSMQADIEYIKERQQVDGPIFPIKELNWPRVGGHSKEDRIQRLEPDFKSGAFWLPCLIYRSEEGGDCYWDADEAGVTYRRSQGPTSAQRIVSERNSEGWRVAQAIKRRDENGNIYDLTQTLMDELKDFPSAIHDDLSDAVSRVYDLDVTPVSSREVNEIDALNESLEW